MYKNTRIYCLKVNCGTSIVYHVWKHQKVIVQTTRIVRRIISSASSLNIRDFLPALFCVHRLQYCAELGNSMNTGMVRDSFSDQVEFLLPESKFLSLPTLYRVHTCTRFVFVKFFENNMSQVLV